MSVSVSVRPHLADPRGLGACFNPWVDFNPYQIFPSPLIRFEEKKGHHDFPCWEEIQILGTRSGISPQLDPHSRP